MPFVPGTFSWPVDFTLYQWLRVRNSSGIMNQLDYLQALAAQMGEIMSMAIQHTGSVTKPMPQKKRNATFTANKNHPTNIIIKPTATRPVYMWPIPNVSRKKPNRNSKSTATPPDGPRRRRGATSTISVCAELLFIITTGAEPRLSACWLVSLMTSNVSSSISPQCLHFLAFTKICSPKKGSP